MTYSKLLESNEVVRRSAIKHKADAFGLRIDILSSLMLFSDYTLLSLLIILTGSIWLLTPEAIGYYTPLRMMALVFAIISAVLRYIKTGSRAEIGTTVVALAFLMAFFGFLYIGANSTLSATVQIVMPLACFAFLAGSLRDIADIELIANRFATAMTAIAILSLVFFFAGSVFNVIAPSSMVSFEWDWTRVAASYYGLYFEHQTIDSFGLIGYRNCGIFSEAPMFVFNLVIALVFNILFGSKNLIKTTVLIIAIITTVSITGYIAVALLFLSKYIFDNSQKMTTQIKLLLVPILALAGAAVVYVFLQEKSSTGSYGVRLDHLLACIQVFLDTLPFGCGIGNTYEISRYLLYDQGLSVGLPYYFAETGLIGVAIIVMPILYGLIQTKQPAHGKLAAAAVVYLWLFMVTNVMFNSMVEWFFLMVVFFGLGRLSDEQDNSRRL